MVAGIDDAVFLAHQIVEGILRHFAKLLVGVKNGAVFIGHTDDGVLIDSEHLLHQALDGGGEKLHFLQAFRPAAQFRDTE